MSSSADCVLALSVNKASKMVPKSLIGIVSVSKFSNLHDYSSADFLGTNSQLVLVIFRRRDRLFLEFRRAPIVR